MKIAIIEDSRMLGSILSTCLKSSGYAHKLYSSKQIQSGTFFSQTFNLLITNTELQFANAQRFVQRLRKVEKRVYILGICNKGDWQTKVNILNCGADDVLSYPFPSQELIARIEALARRPRESVMPQPMKAKGVVINPVQRSVRYKNIPLPIRNKEYTLLEYLMKNKNRPVSRTELIGSVWEYRNTSNSNTIDVHISKLRTLLPVSDIIETIHGVGYKLCDAPSKEKRYKQTDEEDPLDVDLDEI
ncbi:MAG: response regulator transcription factor [Candidatus Dojkabacteria bacterium]|nr:MAG: response regulator transcription factor [Candidatus Dojkabacteria bacterium]